MAGTSSHQYPRWWALPGHGTSHSVPGMAWTSSIRCGPLRAVGEAECEPRRAAVEHDRLFRLALHAPGEPEMFGHLGLCLRQVVHHDPGVIQVRVVRKQGHPPSPGRQLRKNGCNRHVQWPRRRVCCSLRGSRDALSKEEVLPKQIHEIQLGLQVIDVLLLIRHDRFKQDGAGRVLPLAA